MRRLTEFFVDDENYLSCMRLMCFLVTAAVLGVWIMQNIKSPTPVALGLNEAGLVGAAQICKLLQSKDEMRSTK